MGNAPYTHLWSREGFVGDVCVTTRPHPLHDYTDVDGDHAPHRVDLTAVAALDQADPAAPPTAFARSRNGVSLAVSAVAAPSPHVWRNAENDEVHFVQSGELDYVTDWGTLRAAPGDFVFLPRATSHRVEPVSTPTLRVVVETPEAVKFTPPAPFGMVNPGRDIARPDPTRTSQAPGRTTLLVKAFDGVTRYTLRRDPLAMTAIVGGEAPVWKVNLADVQPLTYVPGGGPPAPFAGTPTKDLLLYTMSARPGGRPPQHHNADYDELVFYVRGPAPYGGLSAPATMAWIPKAVAHWGPREDAEDGFLAWLLESGGTVRLTAAGRAAAEPMETGSFGPHPTATR